MRVLTTFLEQISKSLFQGLGNLKLKKPCCDFLRHEE